MAPSCRRYGEGILIMAMFFALWLPTSTLALAARNELSRWKFLSRLVLELTLTGGTAATSATATETPGLLPRGKLLFKEYILSTTTSRVVSTVSSSHPPYEDSTTLRLPLKFLPKGGCWALRITLASSDNNKRGDHFTYYGIVDTGSPFITVPAQATFLLRPTVYKATKEQYGQVLDGMDWRRAPHLTLYGEQDIVPLKNIVVGVASSLVIKETGGIFVGLLPRDDARPTVWEQLSLGDCSHHKYRSFSMDFDNKMLILSKKNLLAADEVDEDAANSLQLVDLTPNGPNLHHYAVLCSELVLFFNGNGSSTTPPAAATTTTGMENTLRIPSTFLDRPLIVVLDTGLTGCIFSDSLTDELATKFPDYGWNDTSSSSSSCCLVGASVHLPTIGGGAAVELTSRDNNNKNNKYWYWNSFRLPWFYDEKTHPHIIAVGTTFWTSTKSLTIDLVSRRVKIDI
jgi:hypothetical protein